MFSSFPASINLNENCQDPSGIVGCKSAIQLFGMFKTINSFNYGKIGNGEEGVDLVALDVANKMPFNISWQLMYIRLFELISIVLEWISISIHRYDSPRIPVNPADRLP